jgi:HK97 family phage major capsid protein/HK97 family phage prohead protease
MGDTVNPHGFELADFRRNPVALWAHDAEAPPIGRAANVRVEENALKGDIEFMSAELYPFADQIYRMYCDGFLAAVSIGFIPIEWSWTKDPDRPFGIDFKRQFLCEISCCPVPVLASALADQAFEAMNMSLTKSLTRSTVRPVPAQPRTGRMGDGGFPSLAANLFAISRAIRDRRVDPRLVRAPTGGNESDPSAGGFLVAPTFAWDLISPLYDENPVAERVTRWESDQPLAEVRMPGIDETSRADGSRWGGALAYWAAEADTLTGSFPRFRNLTFSPKKLIAIVTGTDELMADSPLFDSAIRSIFALEMGFKLDAAIVAGTGAGQPQGILAAPATITIPKETGQATATIVTENIVNMWRRLPAPSRRRAVWLVSEEVEEQLAKLDQVIGAAAFGVLAYQPAGVGGSEYARLLGRPIIAIEQCSALGSLGDIVLADLSKYLLVGGALTPALSADVRFDTDQICWRFTWRVDGQSAYASPVTPFHGSNTRSPFVTLAAR